MFVREINFCISKLTFCVWNQLSPENNLLHLKINFFAKEKEKMFSGGKKINFSNLQKHFPVKRNQNVINASDYLKNIIDSFLSGEKLTIFYFFIVNIFLFFFLFSFLVNRIKRLVE